VSTTFEGLNIGVFIRQGINHQVSRLPSSTMGAVMSAQTMHTWQRTHHHLQMKRQNFNVLL